MIIELCGTALRVEQPTQEGEARWRGMLSPEPETCAWIDGLPAGEVFFDVGANVGTFTARAALRGLNVWAFEPEAERYAQLCRLIRLNSLKAHALPLALMELPYAGTLGAGRSSHTFSVAAEYGDQDAFAVKLDELVYDYYLPQPDHIKIDVDGNEMQIIYGGERAILNAKTVMVEIDPGAPGHDKIVPFMDMLGFGFDPAQVEACMVKAHEYGGKYTGLANHLFRKVG